MAQEFINDLNETCEYEQCWTLEDYNKGRVYCYTITCPDGETHYLLCNKCKLKINNRFKYQARMLCEDCISKWSFKRSQIYSDEADLRYSLNGADWLCDDCALEFITLKEIKEDLDELKELVKKLIDSKI